MSSLLVGKAALATLQFHQGNVMHTLVLKKSPCNAELNTSVLLIHAQLDKRAFGQ